MAELIITGTASDTMQYYQSGVSEGLVIPVGSTAGSIYIGGDGGGVVRGVGFIFRNIPIKTGDTIESAYLRLTAGTFFLPSDNSDLIASICFYNSAYPTFPNYTNFLSGSFLGIVDWTIKRDGSTGAWIPGLTLQSPDISSGLSTLCNTTAETKDILLFLRDLNTVFGSEQLTVMKAYNNISDAEKPAIVINWTAGATPDEETVVTLRNETIFRFTLSGDSGTRTNWNSLFDNTVWTGKATEATAIWNSNRWEVQTGTKYGASYAKLTAAGTDFDTFRPTKLKVTFTGAENIDVTVEYSDTTATLFSAVTTGQEITINSAKQVIAVYFSRSDVYELFPYITNIEFYDADYVPTVIDDVILPVSNFSARYAIEYKDSEGNDMPFWDSASNPGNFGYSMAQSKYRISGTATVPGYEHITDIADRLNNNITIEVSQITTNGEYDFRELFSGLELTKAVPSTGANSVSVQLTFEKSVNFEDVIWLYFVKEHEKHNFISPNGANGENTINFPYFISDMKPGYSLLLTGSDVQYNISEVQWIVSTNGITTYMKE